jgi:SAM-dependent methyltransferase
MTTRVIAAQLESAEYPGTELEATAGARNYTRWVMGEILPHVSGRVAEVGAGIGTVSRALLDTPIERLFAIEPAPALFGQLSTRFAHDPRVELCHGTLAGLLGRLDKPLDTIVYVNVLEHIADDESEMRSAAAALKPGGHVCLFVPAGPGLYSGLDASMGHHRRYTVDSLTRTVAQSGLDVVEVRRFDALGMLTWLVAFKWLGLTMQPGSVRTYDRVVVPLSRLIDVLVRRAFGKSLVLIARKPAPVAPAAGARLASATRPRSRMSAAPEHQRGGSFASRAP